MNKIILKKIAYLLAFSLMLGFSASLVSCDDKKIDEGAKNDPATDAETDANTNNETEAVTEAEVVDQGKSIDLYIIAGQSNGAGYTRIKRADLNSLWSGHAKGDPHVLYTGRAEYTNNVNTPQVSTGVNAFGNWMNAASGQGMSSAHMGPEVGMAKVFLDKYYNEETGKTAGIIKFAHGGTSLLGQTGGENAANGNWVSPIYAAIKGYDYSDDSLHGGLYRDLLEQVRKSVKKLEELEYTDINIKGVFWMQGESDVSNQDEYKIAFKYFVSDLRRDLGAIVGEDLTDLAVIVGEISRTSGSANPSWVAVNEAFIAMQRKLAEDIDHVYTIPSGQYEITTLVNGVDVLDSFQNDAWHWNTEQMFNIGALVADCIIENVLED